MKPHENDVRDFKEWLLMVFVVSTLVFLFGLALDVLFWLP